MEELSKSLKYVPPYQVLERMKSQAASQVEEAVARYSVEVAKQLKKEQVDIGTIVKVTGLSAAQIKKLKE
jgi:hypothetical protein